jgi:hypothetical protein
MERSVPDLLAVVDISASLTALAERRLVWWALFRADVQLGNPHSVQGPICDPEACRHQGGLPQSYPPPNALPTSLAFLGALFWQG